MTTQPGIWQYAQQLKPLVKSKFRLSLNEGHTKLNKINHLYFKREDQNPTGSVKDRGIAFQISFLMQKLSLPLSRGGKEGFSLNNINNEPKFVISSSGNAAISAAAYCQQAKTELTIFVSPQIPKAKLQKLRQFPFKIITTKQPISQAYQYAKQNSAYNLRPSKDLLGPVGYQTIVFELLNQFKQSPEAIFIPTSSGTMLAGIAQGFHLLKKPLPKLYAIQTTNCHPIAKKYDQDFKSENASLATGIVAKVVPRKKQIHDFISLSQGGAYVVSNQQIKSAHQWLKGKEINTSYEGAAALAGYKKAIKSNKKFNNVVILLTGSLF